MTYTKVRLLNEKSIIEKIQQEINEILSNSNSSRTFYSNVKK